MSPGTIAERVETVRRRILRACERSGRDAESVRLIAVTKTHGVETVRSAVRAGLADFGENRVQEGVAKIETLEPDFPGLRWSLIGRLQSNKVKTALKYFEEIQSVDRESLLEKIAREAHVQERVVPILLEVNIGAEESKGGVAPDDCRSLLERAAGMPSVSVTGLMAVPPFADDPEQTRPFFRELFRLRKRLEEETGRPLPELSMGMSHDFEVAIEEGATQVRVGTALFGERETGNPP